MLDVILDTLLDCVKLLPFLFLTYLAMEYIEHKAGERIQETIKKSGKCGPLIGSILGAFPQCGFSAAASNLYAARIITLGTLISIYLSTSDEMLPILISQQVGAAMIWKILGIKVLIGMAAGFLIDIVMNLFLKKEKEALQIEQLCEHHHCQCEKGIVKSALRHTIEIFIYLLLITFILNIFITLIGEDFLANLLLNRPLIGEVIAGLVGLIPNCAASVVITQLYLNGILNEGAMMAGLLVGAGVGILVLLRVNDRPKDNVRIIALLYVLGVAAGIVVELLGITF
ncbi:MAG: arsenic efflux protein [Lachnospiraceae bacterium]|nr:arsenic efflux protein [Lachnospiraceae bacterium]